jgi:hypothetical protein
MDLDGTVARGGLMRKTRTPETEEQRNHRFEKKAQRRIDDAAEADKAIDAMVKQSIELHGP